MNRAGKLSKSAKQRSKPRSQPTKLITVEGVEHRVRDTKRSTLKSGPLPSYIDMISNPVEYIADDRNPMRNPNSAGTTTFVGSYITTLEHTVDCPYVSSDGVVSGALSSIFLATNGVTQERFLRSRAADLSGIVQAEGQFVTQVVIQSPMTTSDGFTSNSNNFTEGIISMTADGSAEENFLASLPDYYGRPAWYMTNRTDQETAINFRFRCPNYVGNFQFLVYFRKSGVWSAAADITVNLLGQTAGLGSYSTAADNEWDAMAISVISSHQQELHFEVNFYATSTHTSVFVPRHQNLLTGISPQFDSEINANVLREYWPCAAGEIITNTTASLTAQGTAFGVSTQRFAGIYNASGAKSMAELITKNKINFYTGPAKSGLSGHSVPRFGQPDPLPFHYRGFASDCRLYLMISSEPQNLTIKIGTSICALGKRTGSIAYGVTHFPPWWPMVVQAVAYINPMSCNPAHSEMFGKALGYIKDFVSHPENIGKLVDGVITAADLASFALESSFPRASGLANQASTVLKQLR